MPSHLDKCVKKLKRPIPDSHIVLNAIADQSADEGAHLVQFSMQYVSNVVWHSRLVSQVQRGLVRIFLTNLEKILFD